VDDLRVTGPRIELRIPRADDAAGLFALGREPEVTRYFSWGPYAEEAQAAAWLETLPARRAEGVALELLMTEREDGAPLGVILLNEFSPRDRRAMVGTWFGRPHWGTGANFEAKALAAHLGFRALGLERLGAYADVRNGRSQTALAKVGFTREGVLRAWHRHGGEPRDVAMYSLLREEWAAGPLGRVEADIAGSPPGAFVMTPSG
jgi:ribosomal-protein-alanine N-acetyltransferase